MVAGCFLAPATFQIFNNMHSDIGEPTSKYPAPFAQVYRAEGAVGAGHAVHLGRHCLWVCKSYSVLGIQHSHISFWLIWADIAYGYVNPTQHLVTGIHTPAFGSLGQILLVIMHNSALGTQHSHVNIWPTAAGAVQTLLASTLALMHTTKEKTESQFDSVLWFCSQACRHA